MRFLGEKILQPRDETKMRTSAVARAPSLPMAPVSPRGPVVIGVDGGFWTRKAQKTQNQ